MIDWKNEKAQAIFLIIIAIFIIVAVGILLFVFRFPSEDSWIKDSKGIYIKHGNPSIIPDYVKEQKDSINCANLLYNQKKIEGMEFNSQCLGICRDFVVEIVHVPRSEEDNLIENQCGDFREGEVKHFIELDKDGNVVRIG